VGLLRLGILLLLLLRVGWLPAGLVGDRHGAECTAWSDTRVNHSLLLLLLLLLLMWLPDGLVWGRHVVECSSNTGVEDYSLLLLLLLLLEDIWVWHQHVAAPGLKV
jgi:hypothetical protein